MVRLGFGAKSLAAWLAMRTQSPAERRELPAQRGSPTVEALTGGRLAGVNSRSEQFSKQLRRWYKLATRMAPKNRDQVTTHIKYG